MLSKEDQIFVTEKAYGFKIYDGKIIWKFKVGEYDEIWLMHLPDGRWMEATYSYSKRWGWTAEEALNATPTNKPLKTPEQLNYKPKPDPEPEEPKAAAEKLNNSPLFLDENFFPYCDDDE